MDKKWSRHLRKNPFAMAPTAALEGGLVDRSNYRRENRSFAEFERQYIASVCESVGIKFDFYSRYREEAVIVGIGHGFTLGTVMEFLKRGFVTKVYDVSRYAIRRNRAPLKELLEKSHCNEEDLGLYTPEEILKHGEIRSVMHSGEIGSPKVVVASRLIAHNPTALLEELGALLQDEEKMVIIIHPLPASSLRKPLSVWRGNYPDSFRASVPYTNPQILRHLSKGAKRKVVRSWPAQTRYYNQVYTAALYKAAA